MTEITGIMKFFPLPNPRKSQVLVIEEIDKVFREGKELVILEAPVGSGKSAIAITLALAESERGESGAHIITPRKALQDQYREDFRDDIVLMKGRNAYPCTYWAKPGEYATIVKAIKQNKIKEPNKHSSNCAEAPCRDDAEVYKECTGRAECPYNLAMGIAQEHQIVVHNFHSFIFQSHFGSKFGKRDLLIIDEAHEIENNIRDFISKSISVDIPIPETEIEKLKTPIEWVDFLMSPKFIPELTQKDILAKKTDKDYVSRRDEYLLKIEGLKSNIEKENKYSIEKTPRYLPNKKLGGWTFAFIPHFVGPAANELLFRYGKKVLLMSGTIYSKDSYCKNLGINPSKAHFIRIGSSFPKENRPIYAKPDYMVDSSHAKWNENFPKLIEICQKLNGIFHDVKGLIHAPSYRAAEQIHNALNSSRTRIHTPDNFNEKLNEFYESKEPLIFISPVCQQGVDFKDDRARFQLIIRVPYLNTSSAFVEEKVKEDFPWYNYQALITFGQQIGRVNRSESDFSATFLVDERFQRFISRNKNVLPQWVKEAIIWK